MRLVETKPATIYTFEVNSELFYRVCCEDGIVTSIEKMEAVWAEGGDAESGPKMYANMATSYLESSVVQPEKDLVEGIEAIIKDAEDWTTYCQMRDADYSAAVYGDSQ